MNRAQELARNPSKRPFQGSLAPLLVIATGPSNARGSGWADPGPGPEKAGLN
jgi:hypothetical protein